MVAGNCQPTEAKRSWHSFPAPLGITVSAPRAPARSYLFLAFLFPSGHTVSRQSLARPLDVCTKGAHRAGARSAYDDGFAFIHVARPGTHIPPSAVRSSGWPCPVTPRVVGVVAPGSGDEKIHDGAAEAASPDCPDQILFMNVFKTTGVSSEMRAPEEHEVTCQQLRAGNEWFASTAGWRLIDRGHRGHRFCNARPFWPWMRGGWRRDAGSYSHIVEASTSLAWAGWPAHTNSEGTRPCSVYFVTVDGEVSCRAWCAVLTSGQVSQ